MIDKNDLLKWLEGVEKRLSKRVMLIAVGGTAMTLLGLKPSTRDIDFCVSSEDKDTFKKALDKEFVVDVFVDGYIFSEQLPDDYVEKSKRFVDIGKIELRVLDPVDIVVTKAARLNARDEEDISVLAKKVKKEEVVKRFEEVVGSFAGNEEGFKYHIDLVLKRYF